MKKFATLLAYFDTKKGMQEFIVDPPQGMIMGKIERVDDIDNYLRIKIDQRWLRSLMIFLCEHSATPHIIKSDEEVESDE